MNSVINILIIGLMALTLHSLYVNWDRLTGEHHVERFCLQGERIPDRFVDTYHRMAADINHRWSCIVGGLP